MNPTILWFRRDLRLEDNPALDWALRRGTPICAVYIHSPEEEAPWAPGGASRWWLHHSLRALAAALAAKGLKLHCLRGPALELIPSLAQRLGADTVVWNRLYEPHLHDRDRRLALTLRERGIACQGFDSGLLFSPGQVLTGQGAPYRVFTPFWRNARRRLERLPPPLPIPTGIWPDGWDALPGEGIESLGLLDPHPWHRKLHAHWKPGEAGAGERLSVFLQNAVVEYESGRDRPDRDGTSRLSPHLHFGEITPRRILAALGPARLTSGDAHVERFLAELGWREFARDLLWHFPHTDWEPLDQRFGEGFWCAEPRALRAWQRGETGIELVDAGMRELWESGWMHNRVRMVAASLLTKNLGLHWREGARWFWETLVDADLAGNSLGWQWVAGCGADAAPYFRIFNPDAQAERFDPQGDYRRRWLPPGPRPAPILDLAESRRAALERYREQMGGR